MNRPVFIIAEAGVNHNGDVALALQLAEAAKAAGADAVKFQTFRARDLVVPGAPTAQYQQKQTGAQDQYAMLEALELSEDQHRAIKAHCDAIGIEFFSTPFSVEAVDMLVRLGVRRIKLSSGELTHRALVEAAAATGLPLLLSSGMATMEEIQEALGWVRGARGHLREVTVFHCTSAYPAPDSALNLSAIPSMARDLGVAIGYSDHSEGIEAAVGAVALGATVIEKHITVDRTLPGPDHSASLEPGEFTQMVTGIRRVEAPTRANAPLISFDEAFGLVKINPIAPWSDEEMQNYIDTNSILVNPLVDEGYPSIGCAPCTKRVAPGDDPRAGRWSGTGKTECGLHI